MVLDVRLEEKEAKNFGSEFVTKFEPGNSTWGCEPYCNFYARMKLQQINDYAILEVERSPEGWGNDIRGKQKGVPLLKRTEIWLSQMDSKLKANRRSFSAPPRKPTELKFSNSLTRVSSRHVIDFDIQDKPSFILKAEDNEKLWREFHEAERKVILNRLRHCKLW